jgi:hypothetical protein
MFSPPPIRSSELRPSRGWYVAAAILAFVVIVAGGVGFAYGIVHAITSVDIKTKVPLAQPTTLTYDTVPARQGIFARIPDRETDPQATCIVRAPSGATVPQLPVTNNFTLTLNNVTWREVSAFDVPAAGDYVIVCTSTNALGFGVGRHVRGSELAGSVLGGLGALALAGVGVLIALIIAIVTAIRRGRYRRRLWAERYPRQY